MNYKTRLKDIKLFAFDYDGVFTNGTVYLMPDGSMARTASARDGFAVQWAVKQGLELADHWRQGRAVRWRMEGLGVKEVHLEPPTSWRPCAPLLSAKASPSRKWPTWETTSTTSKPCKLWGSDARSMPCQKCGMWSTGWSRKAADKAAFETSLNSHEQTGLWTSEEGHRW